MSGFIICTSDVLRIIIIIIIIIIVLNQKYQMRGKSSTHKRTIYQIFWRENLFGRPKVRWEGNIKLNLEEAEWEVFRLYLHYFAQGRGQYDRIAPRVSHVRCHSNPLQFIICPTVGRYKRVSLAQW